MSSIRYHEEFNIEAVKQIIGHVAFINPGISTPRDKLRDSVLIKVEKLIVEFISSIYSLSMFILFNVTFSQLSHFDAHRFRHRTLIILPQPQHHVVSIK